MSYQIDPIEESHLRDAYATLKGIQEFLEQGTPVYPGALLFEDDEPIETHIEDAAEHLIDILKRIEASKYQGGV